MLQQRGLAIRIANGTLAIRFDAGNLPSQSRALAQRRYQHLVDVVETLPQRRKILARHTSPKTRKPPS
jgi:hypothetical protein